MPRTTVLQLRLTHEDKAWLKAAADKAGLGLSEYVRRETGLGKYRRADYQQIAKEPAQRVPAKRHKPAARVEGPDFEQRVKKVALRMPRRTAENLVRTEEARERS